MKSKKISPSEAIASAKSQEIDAKLQQDYIRELNILKLLLLGPGESGKSTFVKQMKILHMQGFSYDDRRLAIPSIHDNTLEAMKLLLSAMRKFEWNSKDLVLEVLTCFNTKPLIQ